MNEKKAKKGMVVSGIGVLISIILVIVQVTSDQSVFTGVVILLSNITLLLVNYYRYKAFKNKLLTPNK